MNKKIVLVQLNEINFDIVQKYLREKSLNNFKKINDNILTTTSEKEYSLLEPWIQWHSAYTGLDASEHKVFRLGDVEKFNYKHDQIFEIIEKKGFKVGAICPMNLKNKCNSPAYFISDPWTKTKNSNDKMSKVIYEVLEDTINNNASSKIAIKNILKLFLIFLIFVRIKKYILFFNVFIKSIKKKWFRSIFLDLLINEIHLNYFKRLKPNFSSVFFNAGAHIQHHYFFNCKTFINQEDKNPEWYIKKNDDPLKDLIDYYEIILDDYMKMEKENIQIIICTGLSQIPNQKKEFYYRLKNHCDFLKKLNINFEKVLPRMSRDFLIEFKDDIHLENAIKTLSNLKIKNKNLFGVIEKRNLNLFITLTYPDELEKNDIVKYNNIELKLYDETVFVAIKNGKHFEKGYIYVSKQMENSPFLKKDMHIKNVFNLLIEEF